MKTTFTNIFKTIPLLLIKFYQKFISPHKGFRCASNVLHKNGSCSGVIFNIINTQPIGQWRSLIKGQFAKCKHASITIQEENNKKKEENKRKNKESNCTDTIDLACCVGDSASCLGRGLGRKADCAPDCADIGSCF